MRSTTAARLREVMEIYELRQVDILKRAEPFCKKYGVKMGRNDISQYVSGKVSPGQEKLTILALALGVSETWLMGYDVPMDRKLESIYIETPDPNNEINIILSKMQNKEQLTAFEQKKISNHLKNAFPQIVKSFKELGDSLFESSLKENFQQLNNENKAKVISYSKNLLQIQQAEEEQEYLIPKAAHERTDVKVTNEMRKHDDDLMDNDDLWK
jgi:transcriptional regulator with XRE-family HTH domain